MFIRPMNGYWFSIAVTQHHMKRFPYILISLLLPAAAVAAVAKLWHTDNSVSIGLIIAVTATIFLWAVKKRADDIGDERLGAGFPMLVALYAGLYYFIKEIASEISPLLPLPLTVLEFCFGVFLLFLQCYLMFKASRKRDLGDETESEEDNP